MVYVKQLPADPHIDTSTVASNEKGLISILATAQAKPPAKSTLIRQKPIIAIDTTEKTLTNLSKIFLKKCRRPPLLTKKARKYQPHFQQHGSLFNNGALHGFGENYLFDISWFRPHISLNGRFLQNPDVQVVAKLCEIDYQNLEKTGARLTSDFADLSTGKLK